MCAYTWSENTLVHFPPHQVSTGTGTCPAKAAAVLQQNRNRAWLPRLALHPLPTSAPSVFCRKSALGQTQSPFPSLWRDTQNALLEGGWQNLTCTSGNTGPARDSVVLPSGRILLMPRTAIRLLTSLLMLWATPGYCGTEWERAV